MSRLMVGYIVIFIGAGVGGMLRHATNRAATLLVDAPVAWSTLAVNVLGGFLVGLAAGSLGLRGESNQLLRLFFMTGVLGGFTTFSAFTLEVGLFIERGHLWTAAVYALASVLLSLLGLFAGMQVLRP